MKRIADWLARPATVMGTVVGAAAALLFCIFVGAATGMTFGELTFSVVVLTVVFGFAIHSVHRNRRR